MTIIYRNLLSDAQRIALPAKLFGGAAFPFKVEPTIFAMAGVLSSAYKGGYWDMQQLSNGGWYMSPSGETCYGVSCMNGYIGTMSADALCITACLYAFSHLSFGGDALAEACADQYHLLREFALDHADVKSIMAAID